MNPKERKELNAALRQALRQWRPKLTELVPVGYNESVKNRSYTKKGPGRMPHTRKHQLVIKHFVPVTDEDRAYYQ